MPTAVDNLLPQAEPFNEWCEGYCEGIDPDREAWEPLIERHPSGFIVVLLFGTASGYEDLVQRDYTVERRRMFANLLTALALNIHQYWCKERRQFMEQGERPNMIPEVFKAERQDNEADRAEIQTRKTRTSSRTCSLSIRLAVQRKKRFIQLHCPRCLQP